MLIPEKIWIFLDPSGPIDLGYNNLICLWGMHPLMTKTSFTPALLGYGINCGEADKYVFTGMVICFKMPRR